MSEVKKIATRESYGNALAELGAEFDNLVVLDADLAAATKTGIFKKAFPERHIDCGIAECNMMGIAAAIRLSRATRKNIRENLFWAFIYNIIGIPLAAGVWIPLFGWQLNPMFGAAAMSLSSFCVVTNALRLNFKKI